MVQDHEKINFVAPDHGIVFSTQISKLFQFVQIEERKEFKQCILIFYSVQIIFTISWTFKMWFPFDFFSIIIFFMKRETKNYFIYTNIKKNSILFEFHLHFFSNWFISIKFNVFLSSSIIKKIGFCEVGLNKVVELNFIDVKHNENHWRQLFPNSREAVFFYTNIFIRCFFIFFLKQLKSWKNISTVF